MFNFLLSVEAEIVHPIFIFNQTELSKSNANTNNMREFFFFCEGEY